MTNLLRRFIAWLRDPCPPKDGGDDPFTPTDMPPVEPTIDPEPVREAPAPTLTKPHRSRKSRSKREKKS